jgi:nucleotide-binding universal stress UspA family protein
MFNPPKMKNILFATDLSDHARVAFDYAAGLAGAFDGRVTVLYVIEKISPNAELLLASLLGYSDLDELRRNSGMDLTEHIQGYIRQFCATAWGADRKCPFTLQDVVVEPGEAVERILYHAGTGSYDTLVMGSRGQGMVRDILMGGTSRKVIINSPIPVFVIPVHPAGSKSPGASG